MRFSAGNVLIETKGDDVLLQAEDFFPRQAGETGQGRIIRILREFFSSACIFPYSATHKHNGKDVFLVSIAFIEFKIPVNCDDERPLSVLEYKDGGGVVNLLIRPMQVRPEGLILKFCPKEFLCPEPQLRSQVREYNDTYHEFRRQNDAAPNFSLAAAAA